MYIYTYMYIYIACSYRFEGVSLVVAQLLVLVLGHVRRRRRFWVARQSEHMFLRCPLKRGGGGGSYGEGLRAIAGCTRTLLSGPLWGMQIAAAYGGDELCAQGTTVPPDPYSLD